MQARQKLLHQRMLFIGRWYMQQMESPRRPQFFPVRVVFLLAVVSGIFVAVPGAWSESEGSPKAPKIVTRAEWKAKPAGKMKPHEQKFITIHHTATKQKPGVPVAEKLRHLQEFSQREDKLTSGKVKPPWPDVPYHFYVGCDGDIGEGRDVNFVGDTNTEYDPTGHVLVTLEGNFQEEEPTEAQIKATRELVAWLAAKYKVPNDKIRSHKDYAQTACPGKNLYRILSEIRPSPRAQ
jgi:hypothetical protein